MLIAHNGTYTMYCNLLTDLRVIKETGYQGIEIIGLKLCRYPDQGFTAQDLLPDGRWSCELFSPKRWELDPWQIARRLKELLECTLI